MHPFAINVCLSCLKVHPPSHKSLSQLNRLLFVDTLEPEDLIVVDKKTVSLFSDESIKKNYRNGWMNIRWAKSGRRMRYGEAFEMIQVNIVVEGQTEEAFVGQTLTPYFAERILS